jgi:VanZ family protein
MSISSGRKSLFTMDGSRLLWAGAVVAVLGLILWGGVQADDPLKPYIHTDKMRHVIGFACLGLLAPFRSSPQGRIFALLAACGCGLGLELVQGFIPDRQMSGKDLLASCIGVFAGYGIGAAGATALELLRSRLAGARADRSSTDA